MSKPVQGLVLGAVLGIIDGLSSWFAPEARPHLLIISVGSTIKGLLTGLVIGIFATKVRSLPKGILAGLALGLFLSFLAAAMPNPTGQHPYLEIMIPGGIIGLILGFTTQRYGKRSERVGSYYRPQPSS